MVNKFENNKIMNFIKKAWGGEIRASLIILFWIFFTCIRISTYGIAHSNLNWNTQAGIIEGNILFYFLLLSPLSIFIHVSLWNTMGKSLFAKVIFYISILTYYSEFRMLFSQINKLIGG